MDNMLLEKYASMLQKQASIKLQQEYGMEKQAFGILGKGVNLLARGAGKATKWGANAVQRGAKAMQKGIGRAGNWAMHAGAKADQAIMNGAKAAWQGAKNVAQNPWVRRAAIASVPGYILYNQHNINKRLDELQKNQPAGQFQQPAPSTPNYSDQVDQWGGTMGNMPVQQPAGLPPGLVSSINYNPVGQFGPYGM